MYPLLLWVQKYNIMSKLKLTDLASRKLSDLQMNTIKGGDCTCGCGCLYQDSGGSSTGSNANANKSGGKFSKVNSMVYCNGEWQRDLEPIPSDSDW